MQRLSASTPQPSGSGSRLPLKSRFLLLTRSCRHLPTTECCFLAFVCGLSAELLAQNTSHFCLCIVPSGTNTLVCHRALPRNNACLQPRRLLTPVKLAYCSSPLLFESSFPCSPVSRTSQHLDFEARRCDLVQVVTRDTGHRL